MPPRKVNLPSSPGQRLKPRAQLRGQEEGTVREDGRGDYCLKYFLIVVVSALANFS
jgi:hypothetical protein